MKNLASLFLIITFVFVFQTCKHDYILILPTEPPPNGADTLICFESEVLPIFQSNCAIAKCHDAQTHEEDIVLDNYNNIMKEGIKKGDAYASKIYTVLFKSDPEERMPPDPYLPLPDYAKILIGRWINQGAQNTVNCAPSCDSSVYTFSQQVKPILQTSCIGCHTGPNAGGSIDLTTYNNVKTQVTNGKLWGSINFLNGFSAMPKNGNKLSACKLTIIRKWIEAGALNN